MSTDFVLWDHDGVIVDTEPWFFEATRATLEDLGVDVSHEQWLRYQSRGQGLVRLVRESSAPDTDLAEIRSRRDDRYDELLRRNDVLIDGALDTLERVAEQRRMALVTTSLRRFVDQLHGDSSVLDHFDFVITAEDCERHKPHPEPYMRAMKLLGASPSHCVAVEDSPRGLTAAVAAGLRCVVVRSRFMQGSDFPGAHAVLDDIRELPSRLTPPSTAPLP